MQKTYCGGQEEGYLKFLSNGHTFAQRGNSTEYGIRLKRFAALPLNNHVLVQHRICLFHHHLAQVHLRAVVEGVFKPFRIEQF